MSIRSQVKEILIRQQNKRYERKLADKRGSYREWIARREASAQEQFSAQELKQFLAQGQGSGQESDRDRLEELVYVIASKGRLSEGARQSFERYFAEHPECQIAYGDEDVWPAGQERTSPWFKPDWSPDLLETSLYFGSIVVLRRNLWERAQEVYGSAEVCENAKVCKNAGFGEGKATPDWMEASSRPEKEGCPIYRVAEGETAWTQYERWLHSCVALSGAYIRGRKAVGHIQRILFHCDSKEEQEKFLECSKLAGQRMEAVERDFRDGFCHPAPQGRNISEKYAPVVSVIIPSKDHAEILEKCLRGCKAAGTEGLPCEIVVVDNGSGEKDRRRIEGLVKELEDEWWSIRYLYQPMEFHFSRMCNLGAVQARGMFLLFLNDDVELCQPECILRMAALADRDYTGAVGMKLYYPNTRRIQHAGITNLPMGPVHKLQFLDDNDCYYNNANRGWRNVLAVTAACLMIEKEKFDGAGGFAEELRVAFNDVDLGFALYEQGYHNVCVNDQYAYHHESLSRGDDESPEKLRRLLAERDILYRRHPGLEWTDPYYPEGLGREGLDTCIRPAYETCGNVLQEPAHGLTERDLAEFRRDNCLLLRVEQSREGVVQGYSVVLGDNNACYEYTLLLSRESEQSSETPQGREAPPEETCCGKAYTVSLEGQYRPDLEENMPDQINVGLCGFHIRLTADNIPPGCYRIGMAARNRVTGLKLMNFSSRFLEVCAESGCP